MRVCSGPGCLRKVADDVRFCDECRPARPAANPGRVHTSGYDAELDRLRKSPRWQRTRAVVAKRDPICKRCDRALTEIVDHVVPAREAITQAQLSGLYRLDKHAGYFFVSNLQGLCRACHWVKTNEDKLHTGQWPDVVAAEQAQPKRRFTF